MATEKTSKPSRIRHREMSDSQFERIIGNGASVSLVLIGFVVLLAVFKIAQVILAPAFLAVVIGLMFGPVADRLEKWGIPPALSAAFVVLLFLGIIAGGVMLFAVPLSEWIDRAPRIWDKLRSELLNWREPLAAISGLQEQITSALGTEDPTMTVEVADGNPVAEAAMIVPEIAAQVGIFLGAFYFYLATREHIRVSLLSLCVSRRMRWRAAHIFTDVEHKVSRFLLSVTVLNFGVGVAVGLSLWALGMPSPLLWGALAFVLNYVPYVGQASMVIVLLGLGLGTETQPQAILAPVGCYLAINFLEGQIITPHFLGHTMTLNPFLIFFSIAFWLWAWGPIGGLISVPMLLIFHSVLTHIIPARQAIPSTPVRRTPRMSEKDLVLATAAQVIKEQQEDEADPSLQKERQDERETPPAGTAPYGAVGGGSA